MGNISNRSEKSMPNKQNHMTARFSTCKLLKVERRTDIGQKYAFLFRLTPLQIENFGEITLWTLSLPVMVTVHGSQDCDLYSAIFWQRAFGSVNYDGENQDEFLAVSWPDLAQAIGQQFIQFTGATVPLSEDHIKYIAEKFLGPVPLEDPKRENTFVTHTLFAKDPMKGVGFSCWDWLFDIMQYVKEKEVLEFWDQGWFMGFISKEEAVDKMNSLVHPTFLLRFSDRVRKAASIAYVIDVASADGLTTERQAIHLNPIPINDLNKLSLAERIQSMLELRSIYPGIDKEQVVRHFKSKEPSVQIVFPYVRSRLLLNAIMNRVPPPPTERFQSMEAPMEVSSVGNAGEPVEDNQTIQPYSFVYEQEGTAWSDEDFAKLKLPNIETIFGEKYNEMPMPLLSPADMSEL